MCAPPSFAPSFRALLSSGEWLWVLIDARWHRLVAYRVSFGWILPLHGTRVKFIEVFLI